MANKILDTSVTAILFKMSFRNDFIKKKNIAFRFRRRKTLPVFRSEFGILMSTEELTVERKALRINLTPTSMEPLLDWAGQEVARHFFQAGGAAGTVAKKRCPHTT